jgi:hypothetical protein
VAARGGAVFGRAPVERGQLAVERRDLLGEEPDGLARGIGGVEIRPGGGRRVIRRAAHRTGRAVDQMRRQLGRQPLLTAGARALELLGGGGAACGDPGPLLGDADRPAGELRAGHLLERQRRPRPRLRLRPIDADHQRRLLERRRLRLGEPGLQLAQLALGGGDGLVEAARPLRRVGHLALELHQPRRRTDQLAGQLRQRREANLLGGQRLGLGAQPGRRLGGDRGAGELVVSLLARLGATDGRGGAPGGRRRRRIGGRQHRRQRQGDVDRGAHPAQRRHGRRAMLQLFRLVTQPLALVEEACPRLGLRRRRARAGRDPPRLAGGAARRPHLLAQRGQRRVEPVDGHDPARGEHVRTRAFELADAPLEAQLLRRQDLGGLLVDLGAEELLEELLLVDRAGEEQLAELALRQEQHLLELLGVEPEQARHLGVDVVDLGRAQRDRGGPVEHEQARLGPLGGEAAAALLGPRLRRRANRQVDLVAELEFEPRLAAKLWIGPGALELAPGVVARSGHAPVKREGQGVEDGGLAGADRPLDEQQILAVQAAEVDDLGAGVGPERGDGQDARAHGSSPAFARLCQRPLEHVERSRLRLLVLDELPEVGEELARSGALRDARARQLLRRGDHDARQGRQEVRVADAQPGGRVDDVAGVAVGRVHVGALGGGVTRVAQELLEGALDAHQVAEGRKGHRTDRGAPADQVDDGDALLLLGLGERVLAQGARVTDLGPVADLLRLVQVAEGDVAEAAGGQDRQADVGRPTDGQRPLRLGRLAAPAAKRCATSTASPDPRSARSRATASRAPATAVPWSTRRSSRSAARATSGSR